MNFVRYRPFVLGLARARGHLMAMPFSTCTIGGRRGHIAPFADHFKRENVGPAYPSGCLDGVLKVAGTRGHWRTVTEDNKRGAISAKHISVLALHADGRKLCAQRRHLGETMPDRR